MTTTKKLDELEKNKKTTAADAVSGGGALPVTGYKAPASQNQSAAGEQNPRVTALRQYLENTVGGTPTESDLLKNVRAQLMNRTGFTYDHNNDPRFQQYFETAKRSGKMAMQDTMGQAASLTGGYANSWAQSAGQAAYNGYLQDANEMIPEFEELARARYDAETAALGDQYAILKGEHDEALEDYWNRYGIAREDWYTEQDRQTAEKQYDYEKKQREIELLLSIGDYDALDKLGINTTALRSQQNASGASAAFDQNYKLLQVLMELGDYDSIRELGYDPSTLKAKNDAAFKNANAGYGVTSKDIESLKKLNGDRDKVGALLEKWIEQDKIDEEIGEFYFEYYTKDQNSGSGWLSKFTNKLKDTFNLVK
ncbi:MAG: hypothetical protein IJD22_03155 [Clostridia bacterium]|nr:hypothetical protein [Clostridia bacterium]